MQLSQSQIDTIAERAQTIRLEGKPKTTEKTLQEVSTESWRELTSPARDFVRLTVKSTIQALEAAGFEVQERRETGQGAGR